MRLSDENLTTYLAARGLLAQPEGARVEPAGDGNINFVRRVRSADGRSWIVKQARDALERFPEYRVTTERIVFESRYLRHAADAAPDHAALLPTVYDFDEAERVLVLEDLGPQRLDGRGPEPEALETLGAFLGAVHAATRERAAELAAQFENDEMRRLHGEHIYTLPYELGAFPLSDTVRKAADEALGRPGVRDAIAELRAHYYEDRDALVHADVQPGNVLLCAGRPRLVDAEIAHVGDPAFDLGVALAHTWIRALASDDARRWEHAAERLVEGYLTGGGASGDIERAHRHAGVEMLRRTLGAARLPLLETDGTAELAIARGCELATSRG
jgi:5-methylthioribose kinase